MRYLAQIGNPTFTQQYDYPHLVINDKSFCIKPCSFGLGSEIFGFRVQQNNALILCFHVVLRASKVLEFFVVLTWNMQNKGMSHNDPYRFCLNRQHNFQERLNATPLKATLSKTQKHSASC